MRKIDIPPDAISKHSATFEQGVEDGLNNLKTKYANDIPILDYLKCLMKSGMTPNNDAAGIQANKSIVVRNVVELDATVKAVEAVKSKYPNFEWKKFEGELKKQFKYGRFSNGSMAWNSGKFIEMLANDGHAYCPYCNAHIVEAYKVGNKVCHKDALDHFYDKSDYPYLALSLYNLIPICNTCNNKKRNKKMTLAKHSHPYQDDFHQLLKFGVIFKDDFGMECYQNAEESDVQEISFRSLDYPKNRGLSLATTVELHERYQQVPQKSAAVEVCKSNARCCGNSLKNLIKLAEAGQRTVCEAVRKEFGVQWDGSDINNCELGKLRNDLMSDEIKQFCTNESLRVSRGHA